jgi:hypothetical protein
MITFPHAGAYLYNDYSTNKTNFNMKTPNFKKIGLWLVGGIVALVLVFGIIGFNNNEVDLRNQFTQKGTERTAFYDKMWKTISQKSQIALRNDSSFRQNVELIMSGRRDAEGLFMKWVTESNPNANFQEVSALYKDLSRSVEAEREGFFQQEKVLQDIKLQHDNLLSKFPTSFYGWLLGKKRLDYKPITSDRTDEVIKTGKDNDVNVFK